MNDKIEEKEVDVLEAASMEYPTWGCFKGIISEAKDNDFPSDNHLVINLYNANNNTLDACKI